MNYYYNAPAFVLVSDAQSLTKLNGQTLYDYFLCLVGILLVSFYACFRKAAVISN